MKGGARARKPAPPLEGGKVKALSKAELLPIAKAHVFAGIPPVCLEIAKGLKATPEGGMRYELAASAKGKLDEIEAYMRGRVTRALAVLDVTEHAVKVTRADGDLCFWLVKRQTRATAKKAKP